MIQFDGHIFQMGWSHQLGTFFRQVGLNASEQKLESLAASEGSQFHRSGGLRSRLAAADGRDAELMEFFSPGLEAKKDEYKMGYDRIYDDI